MQYNGLQNLKAPWYFVLYFLTPLFQDRAWTLHFHTCKENKEKESKTKERRKRLPWFMCPLVSATQDEYRQTQTEYHQEKICKWSFFCLCDLYTVYKKHAPFWLFSSFIFHNIEPQLMSSGFFNYQNQKKKLNKYKYPKLHCFQVSN